MGEDLERRKMDEEFRRQLAERLVAAEKGFEHLRDEVRELRKEILDIKMAELDLHYTLFGGPRPDDQGLLEKFRKLLYKFGLAITLAFAVLAFAGKLIEPLYQKIFSDWAYNSISERWIREKSQPKIKKYIIHQRSPSDED